MLSTIATHGKKGSGVRFFLRNINNIFVKALGPKVPFLILSLYILTSSLCDHVAEISRITHMFKRGNASVRVKKGGARWSAAECSDLFRGKSIFIMRQGHRKASQVTLATLSRFGAQESFCARSLHWSKI